MVELVVVVVVVHGRSVGRSAWLHSVHSTIRPVYPFVPGSAVAKISADSVLLFWALVEGNNNNNVNNNNTQSSSQWW